MKAYQIKQATSLIIHRHFPVLNGSLTSAVWLQLQQQTPANCY